MRTILAKLLVTLAITALGAFAADNTIGTWKLNIAKSKFTPAPSPVKSLTATREAADGGVKVSTTGEQADGTAIKASYTAKYDGKENSVTGNAPYDKIAIKQVNANTLTANLKKSDGKYRATGRSVVSKDGKTMTTTTRGANADGKAFTYVMVYDKQ